MDYKLLTVKQARKSIVYDNLDGYAKLTAELKTPIQIGKNFYGPRDLHKALMKRACDLVMPDFMRIGGVAGWLRAAAIAGAAGIPVSTHLYPEVAAHVMRVTETAHWLEWQNWVDPILQKPYRISASLLHIPDVPGVGLEWDEDAVTAYRLDILRMTLESNLVKVAVLTRVMGRRAMVMISVSHITRRFQPTQKNRAAEALHPIIIILLTIDSGFLVLKDTIQIHEFRAGGYDHYSSAI